VDALKILASLTPEQITDRLNEIEREADALRVLLRSARARQVAGGREQRHRRQPVGDRPQGAPR
jgi:hypothetical protein